MTRSYTLNIGPTAIVAFAACWHFDASFAWYLVGAIALIIDSNM